MTDAQLYAHYKKTSHIEDVRFFLGAATLSSALACEVADLLALAPSLPRAEVFRRLRQCQIAWSREAEGWQPSNEAKFWEAVRRSKRSERGKAFREARDRAQYMIRQALDRFDRGSYYDADDHEFAARHAAEAATHIAHLARKLCPWLGEETAVQHAA